MKLLFAAVLVIIAIFFLTRRKTKAGPALDGAAISPSEADEMNRAAKERRRGALSSRWWNC